MSVPRISSSHHAIVRANPSFTSWVQVGHPGDIPGQFRILDHDGNTLLKLPLHKRNGLYYFALGDFGTAQDPAVMPLCSKAAIKDT